MAKSSNRRSQTPKPIMGSRNERYMEGMQELRRSNAAGPHKPASAYQRKPKHAGQGYAE